MVKRRGGSKKAATKSRAKTETKRRPGAKKGMVKTRPARVATKKVVRKKASGQPRRTVKKAKRISVPLTVFTIVFSNHDYAEVVGSPNAPYFNQLISAHGLAMNYHDAGIRPSLPNYLVLVSGSPQSPVATDLGPTQPPFPLNAANLGTQLEAANIPWRSYQESMGAPGKLVASGNYNPKHDPFLYFDDIQKGSAGFCAAHNVDYSQFASDLAAGSYRFAWISPDLRNSGHDPINDPISALKTADAWAQANVPPILQSAAFKANGVLFITWGQAAGRSAGSDTQVPMIIVSPRLNSPGFSSNTRYDHKSYLATIEDLLKLPRLPTVKDVPSMREFFR